jgi:serine/threonine protein kinase
MVDNEGRAKLIDFGVSRITGEHKYITSKWSASWAWAAPEMSPYDDLAVRKTYSSDIWALAITFVEESFQ